MSIDRISAAGSPRPSAFTKPPMAAAIRKFVVGMKFPRAPGHGPNPNIGLAGVTIAMLQFSHGITPNAATVACSPPLSAVAALLHCSISSIKRSLRRLRGLGLLSRKDRGHNSAIYTFYKVPAKGQEQTPSATHGSERSSTVSAGSTVDPLWCKPFGVEGSGISIGVDTPPREPEPGSFADIGDFESSSGQKEGNADPEPWGEGRPIKIAAYQPPPSVQCSNALKQMRKGQRIVRHDKKKGHEGGYAASITVEVPENEVVPRSCQDVDLDITNRYRDRRDDCDLEEVVDHYRGSILYQEGFLARFSSTGELSLPPDDVLSAPPVGNF